jgi:GT2 family glycosyltransferase
VRGKFIFVGEDKLWVRGVTYGAFRPDAAGSEYHDLDVIDRDFAQMAANGINAVRIPHTMPPRALLDVALRHGLYVMVGLSAEQYVGYLIDKKDAPDIEGLVRAKVRTCAGHPALLCYAIGNEIAAPVARWLGRRRVERYLEGLYRAIKAEDPAGLVTYVNYPTTEYLQLPFLDLVCFNVYLESPGTLDDYLARLQNIAGDRPVVMSEIGLDGMRNGELAQAVTLDWQVRTTFAAGCAGAFIFSWTDEWFRAGADVDDWEFGLTRRDREPKPALAAVRDAFYEVPFPKYTAWPRISVVVCTYNGSRTIRDCLDGLLRLSYPDFEVIVVNDGSRDNTLEIVRPYGFRLISTTNQGLSNARNTGLHAATGEIVAYIDDDAYPDPDWLTYLAATFRTTSHVGIGGPNLPPPGDGWIADCVANAPGGPIHVLLSDREAEHIPGCNMAFRKAALEAIGGFDPRFRTAGDDVDVCWRLQGRGGTLGFSPAAVVWHHRRNSVRTYWRQQQGYAKAEALLAAKWPEKYNTLGHLTWGGRLYGRGLASALTMRRDRIFHGTWGMAPFQSLYQPAGGTLTALLLMPESYLLLLALTALAGMSSLWSPLRWCLVPPTLGMAALLVQAGLSAAGASFTSAPRSRLARWRCLALTTLLHLMQPLARLHGRFRHGLIPWRWVGGFRWPWPRRLAVWTEHWIEPHERIESVEAELCRHGGAVLRGAEFDRWDLEVQGGMFGAARVLMAVEDHGAGTQFVRARAWPRCLRAGLWPPLLLAVLSGVAALDHCRTASGVLAALGAALLARVVYECGVAMAQVSRAIHDAVEDDA